MKTKLYPVLIMVMLLTVITNYAAYAQCGGYTLTQGAYANAKFDANGNGINAGGVALQGFTGPVTIGCAGGTSWTFTNVADIQSFLTSHKGNDVVYSQVLTLALNVRFDSPNLGSQIVLNGPFAGQTVNQFLQNANNIIGGCASGDLSAVNVLASAINEYYDEGQKPDATQPPLLSCCDKVGPVFSGVGADKTIECSDAVVFSTPTATDAQDGASVVTYTDSRSEGTCSYTITRTWSATDKCNNTTTASQTITIKDTTAPVLAGVPADASVSCDKVPAAAAVTATDNCNGATVTLSESTAAGSCVGNYTITRTWTATDACGNSSSATQVITVSDNTAPVLAGVPVDASASCDNVPAAAAVSATDNCSGATVSMTETKAAGNCAGNYTITRTWTAVDGCGNASSATQVITVSDTNAPSFSNVPANATVSCGNVTASVAPTATDNCSGVASVTFNESKAAGNCAGNYTITRTWTATDGCGNSSSVSQTITVVDNQAPVFSNVPANATASCSNIPTSVAPTATDNCSGATVSFSEVKSAVDCSGNYTITRTWTAVDGCGNSSSASQVITVNEIACKYTTVTQGGWGANCNGGNWGCYLDKNFAANFPTGLTVGSVANGKYVTLTSASAIHAFLPTGGTPSALTKGWTNPTKKTLGNTLVGQAVTATLNVKMFPTSANLVVLSGPFTGKTVQQVVDIANATLAGSLTYSASSVTEVLNNINVNFDDGNGTNHGFLGYCVPNSGARDIANNNESLTSPANEFVSVSTYPNPFVDRIKFEFTVQETSHVNLQLFNSNGVSVGTLFNGVAEKGVQYNAEYSSSLPGMYIYRMSTSAGVVSGKVIQIK